MSEDGPSKTDIAAVFKKLRSYSANKVCFDCGAKNPTWASVTYGVFICIDCSAVHRGLGVHLSFVRSTQLDTNWTWLQIRGMQLGGNSNATQFFRQHGCTTTDSQQKYKSRAAQLYREKLHHIAVAAMRLHGTKLHVETAHGEPQSPTSTSPKEEPDFFAQHTAVTDVINMPRNESQTSISEEAYIGARKGSVGTEEKAPSVNLDDNVSVESGKSGNVGVIGQRRAPQKKTTGKKSAFGAQKMVADFSEIERQAEALEKTRLTPVASFGSDDAAKQEAAPAMSTRFLAQDKAKRDEQMKRLDPKKFEQVERLGMALGDPARGKASHSVLADIKPIQQEENRSTGFGNKIRDVDITLDDEWDIIGGAKNTDKSLNWGQTNSKEDNGFSWSKSDQDDQRSRRTNVQSSGSNISSNVDAQKKFGGAKAISSDQFFGASGAADYEVRTNLTRFEGSNAISSAELFGNDAGNRGYRPGGSYSSTVSQLPDITDLKDSVRQGVTKVAGKLSQFSAGMSNYLSDRYGN